MYLRSESPDKYKLGQMTLCFVGSSFCLSEKRPPKEFRHHKRQQNKKQNYQRKKFPIGLALTHRLKTRMMPFKDVKKKIKNFAQNFMGVVTLFLMPICYIAFKDFVCKIKTRKRWLKNRIFEIPLVLSRK